VSIFGTGHVWQRQGFVAALSADACLKKGGKVVEPKKM